MSTFLIDTAQSEVNYRHDRIRDDIHRSPVRGWRRRLRVSDSGGHTGRAAVARNDAAARYRPALWVAHHS